MNQKSNLITPDNDLVDRVAEIPLFSELPNHEIAELMNLAVYRKILRNQMMVSLGEKTDSFYVILSGTMRVIVGDEEGREVIITILNSGDFFGEMGLIDDSPRCANVISGEPCEILVFSKENFRSIIMQYPLVNQHLMRAIIERLRKSTKKIETLALMDVYKRVARLLYDFSRNINGKRIVIKKLSKQDIARMVGASREMVSRVMRNLNEQGNIAIQDGKIYLSEEKEKKIQLTSPPLPKNINGNGTESTHQNEQPPRGAMSS